MNNTKVLRFFLDNSLNELSKKDVCRGLNMNRHSVHWAMIDLLFQRMIVEKKGRPNLYSLHPDLKS